MIEYVIQLPAMLAFEAAILKCKKIDTRMIDRHIQYLPQNLVGLSSSQPYISPVKVLLFPANYLKFKEIRKGKLTSPLFDQTYSYFVCLFLIPDIIHKTGLF